MFIARIFLKSSADGGRKQVITPETQYGCPVYFKDTPALSKRAYDCRLLLAKIDKSISPGEMLDDVPIAFLSTDELKPHLKTGTEFVLWEGREIGIGIITSISS